MQDLKLTIGKHLETTEIAAAPPVGQEIAHRRTYHGIALDDSYAWLRDPHYPTVDDPEIIAHLQAENAWFNGWMAPYAGLVDTIFAELRGRIKEDDASVPVAIHGWDYQSRFEIGAQYRRWYRWPSAGGAEQLILDEPALAAGREIFRLGAFAPSPDGKFLAYSSDDSGGERFTLWVKDLTQDELLPIEIIDTMGDVAWSADGAMLFYAVLNAEWRPYQIKAHRFDQPAADWVVYEEPDPGFRVSVGKSQSRTLILINSGDHVTSEAYFIPADRPLDAPKRVAPRRDGVLYSVDHGAGFLWIHTNDTHRNFRIARATVDHPENWEDVIAGSDGHYLRGLHAFENFLAIEERIDGLDQIRLRNPDATEHYLVFPETAYEVGFGSNPSPDPTQLRLVYSSLVRPATTFAYDVAKQSLATLKTQEIPSGYDPGNYVAERLLAPSRDGVNVPISLVYKRGWKQGVGAPLHLYGYGAYGLGMSPSFSASRISLLDRGFAYAIAHIRGGDELGRGWYEDGKRDKRQNSFNDFIDAAKFLVAEDYAEPGGISISGGSAGGQLMGAVANQAPELWRAVVAHVPFVDALNTMLDPTLPLTPPEWPEWGNPIEDKAAFETIRAYSPYDNVAAQSYPPLFVTAGLNDPRVTYWEPAKWVARLRALKTDHNPLIFKINMGAGHGGKSGRFKRLREIAEEFVFILVAFGLESDEKRR